MSGVQARIKAIEPKALFIHCCGHALNLAVVGACGSTYIRNMFYTLGKLRTFFTGSKRNATLNECIMSQPDLNSQDKKTLQYLSDTRWNSKYSALKSFEVIYTCNY